MGEEKPSGTSARKMIDALAMSEETPKLAAPEAEAKPEPEPAPEPEVPEAEKESAGEIAETEPAATEQEPEEAAEQETDAEPPAEAKKRGRKSTKAKAEEPKDKAADADVPKPDDANSSNPVASVEAEKPKAGTVPLVVRAISDFGVCVNGCMKKYVAGQIEGDYITARYLLESGCPVSVVGSDQFHQCPNCKHIYK